MFFSTCTFNENKTRCRPRKHPLWYLLAFLLVLLMLPSTLLSQGVKEIFSTDQNQFGALLNSIDTALISEKENIETLTSQLNETKTLGQTIAFNLSARQAQLSSHGNLLLLSDPRIEVLEQAKIENLASIEEVKIQLKELNEYLKAARRMRMQAEEQYTLNERQLDEIKRSNRTNENTQVLKKNLQTLLELITTKKSLLDRIESFYIEQIGLLENTLKAHASLSEKFDRQLKEKKRETLFERKSAPLSLLKFQAIKADTTRLLSSLFSLFSIKEWPQRIQAIHQTDDFHSIIALILLAVVVSIFIRFRNFCVRKQASDMFIRFPRFKRMIKIFDQSLVLIGLILFIYALKYMHLSLLATSATKPLLYLLIVWLGTKWWVDFLAILSLDEDEPILGVLLGYLRFIIILIRYFALTYIFVAWVMGGEGTILYLGRMLFELTFFIWYIFFIRNFKNTFLQTPNLSSPRKFFWGSFLPGIGYIITGGGLLLDVIGYGTFALYWNVAWGRTALIFLWGYLLFQVLQEWGHYLKQTTGEKRDEAAMDVHPIRWFLNRICWLAWVVALVLAITFAWGARQTIIVSSIQILKKTISIGSLSFSLISLFYACLILFFTVAGSRIWRDIFNTKILTESVLEPGLKESIVTISVYFFWGIGIFIALNVIGFSSTSLTVVFGALSIGLGFGLQNIFNNFISGIILLFERPIQVGDAVELNGIWGEVKKINVRATVVQTYDNASLIIPNSEFISSQVTNWSFKDLRLRRKIVVGVAYGSDTELTRNTLLEVAEKNNMILRYPKPDVLFQDFGDSALIFVLRIWTNVNNMLTVESNVRFEIDRLFRKRGIEIAFPQQDIHVRSITGTDKLLIEPQDRSPSEPQAKN
jgi:small-conductance mechanosensitive channel